VGLDERWGSIFMAEFCGYHWVCPYPDPNSTLISTAHKTRNQQWWALDRDLTEKGWKWAIGKARSGRPEAYPAALQLSNDDFAAHLDQIDSLGRKEMGVLR
jgi:hypothetical protein